MTSSTAVPLFSGKSHSLNLEDIVGKILKLMEGCNRFLPHPLVVVRLGEARAEKT